MSHRNQVIEYIARKSLICLILTFVVNLTMNLFKVTKFLGDRSDVKYMYIFISKMQHTYYFFFFVLVIYSIF